MDTVPRREITTRRIAFPFDSLPAKGPHHFAGGDLIMSHVVAMLSAMFPDGEDFFVATVRDQRDRITDPELRRQVGRFIGQEAVHGREHRALNERLQRLGYRTRQVERAVDIALNRMARRLLPPTAQLAITAALEHYTATLAEVLLTDPEAQDMLSGDIRDLLLWHALEESEHKAVAFDVYEAVSGHHLVRVATMNAVTALFLLAVAVSALASMRHDPATADRATRRESWRRLRRSPFLSRRARARIRDYNRRGFHPDDHDTEELLRSWREQLFGAAGLLAGRAV